MIDFFDLTSFVAFGLTYFLHSTVWILLMGLLLKLPVLNVPLLKNYLWKLALAGSFTTAVLAFGHRAYTFEIPSTKEVKIMTEASVQEKNVLDPQIAKEETPESAIIDGPFVAPSELYSGNEPFKEKSVSLISTNNFTLLVCGIITFWLIASLFLGLKCMLQHKLFFKRIGQRKKIDHPTVLHLLQAIQSRAQTKARVQLTCSPLLTSPIVIRNREICLPEQALETMDSDQLEAMIAHELAHIVRRDYYWTFLLLLVDILFFFQPLHRILKREIHSSNELLCDAWAANVTGNAVALAECLLEVATWISHQRPNYTLVAGMALQASELSNRISQLLKLPDMTLQKFKFLKIGLPALGVLGLILLVLPGFSFVLLNSETFTQSNIQTFEGDCKDLLRAVKASNIQKVKELLKTVDPDCAYYDDGEPRSSLVAAARNGHLEIGKILLAANADVEYHARGDESPLIAAARYGHLDFVKILVAKGAKVNRKVSGDGNALIGAVRGRHYEVAQFLLEKGADPYQNVSGDEYAMYHARVSGNRAMIKLLAQYEK